MSDSDLRGDRVISSIPRDLNFIKEKENNNYDRDSDTDRINNNNKCNYKNESCPHLVNQSSPSSTNTNTNTAPIGNYWVYPSAQMFWNAMKRKGTLPDHLKDLNDSETHKEMDWIVTIHNVVNEQCWQEISKWERFRVEGCRYISNISDNTNKIGNNTAISNGSSNKIIDNKGIEIKLQRFLGRPDDLSPKAWFKSKILGYRKPFDRHDWFVKSNKESLPPRRYIIDFYTGKGSDSSGLVNSVYLDVRPAMDSVDEAVLRVKKFVCDKVKWMDGKLKILLYNYENINMRKSNGNEKK